MWSLSGLRGTRSPSGTEPSIRWQRSYDLRKYNALMHNVVTRAAHACPGSLSLATAGNELHGRSPNAAPSNTRGLLHCAGHHVPGRSAREG